MIFSENRLTPRIKSGAGFSGSCSSGAMVRWKGCDSLPDGRLAIVRVDEAILPLPGWIRSALGNERSHQIPEAIRVGFPQHPEFTCVGRLLLDLKRNAEPVVFFRLAFFRFPGLADLGLVIERLTLDHAVAGAAPQESLRGRSAQATALHAAGAVDIELDRFPVEHAVCAGYGVPPPDRTVGEDAIADGLVGEVHRACHERRLNCRFRKRGRSDQRRSASQ